MQEFSEPLCEYRMREVGVRPSVISTKEAARDPVCLDSDKVERKTQQEDSITER